MADYKLISKIWKLSSKDILKNSTFNYWDNKFSYNYYVVKVREIDGYVTLMMIEQNSFLGFKFNPNDAKKFFIYQSDKPYEIDIDEFIRTFNEKNGNWQLTR